MISRVIYIEVIDDHIYEDKIENFTVFLSTPEVRVHLVNASTIVNIIDDDSELVYCTCSVNYYSCMLQQYLLDFWRPDMLWMKVKVQWTLK